MNVAYFFVDHGHEASAEHRLLALRSIWSVRKHIPNANIIHLADYKTKTLDGVDEVIAARFDPKTFNRAHFQAQVWGPCIFLDTDTIVTRDVSDVFKQKFDIAVAKRPEGWEGTEKYNGGVIFSTGEHFWKDFAKHTEEHGCTDQTFSDFLLASGYRKLELPEAYNFSPPDDVAVLHFKGPRKKTMLAL